MLALNQDKTAAIVDINGRQVQFRITVVRPYYKDDSIGPHAPSPDNDEREAGDEYFPEVEQQPPRRRRRGRPKGSKNKPKAVAPVTPAANIADVFLAPREEDAIILARGLRAAGTITTPGEPFEQSTKAEIDALITRGVFRFKAYNPTVHGGNRIFKSRIVNEVKGKLTSTPYEKSRLVIQGFNDDGKKVVLTQSPTIQRAS